MANNEQGLAGTVLVIIIAWALAAVLMLTVTLVAAQDIEATVGTLPDPEEGSVLNEVYDIDGNLGPVALATSISRKTDDILLAAEPLDGQLDQVLAATDSIDASANSILGSASEINSSVHSIDSSVSTINSSVVDIQNRLAATDGHVDEIEPNIDRANEQASTILALVREIKTDTGSILGNTRTGDEGDWGIEGHATSIDCRLLAGVTENADCPGGPVSLPSLDGLLDDGLLNLDALNNLLDSGGN